MMGFDQGHSKPGMFGSTVHYDERDHEVGHSNPGLFGNWRHYED